MRSSDAFQQWAEEARLNDFEIVREAAAQDAPDTGVALWLVFSKQQL